MRVGGIINLKVDGQLYKAKGAFDYDLGIPKKEAVVGMDGTHGYKELPQVSYIEGTITDQSDISFEDLAKITGATVTLELGNGKVIVLREAFFASNSKANSEEGEIEARFESAAGQAEEIR
jgi:hypothetical protein